MKRIMNEICQLTNNHDCHACRASCRQSAGTSSGFASFLFLVLAVAVFLVISVVILVQSLNASSDAAAYTPSVSPADTVISSTGEANICCDFDKRISILGSPSPESLLPENQSLATPFAAFA